LDRSLGSGLPWTEREDRWDSGREHLLLDRFPEVGDSDRVPFHVQRLCRLGLGLYLKRTENSLRDLTEVMEWSRESFTWAGHTSRYWRVGRCWTSPQNSVFLTVDSACPGLVAWLIGTNHRVWDIGGTSLCAGTLFRFHQQAVRWELKGMKQV